jgi:hypothetical protein
MIISYFVIPAKAGISSRHAEPFRAEAPASAGATGILA